MLLPPSKGKAEGGDGPPLMHGVDGAHPLGDARREVLEAAVTCASVLSDHEIVRVFGVRSSHVDRTRASMAGLAAAPTMPARRRYTGIVHGNAGLASGDASAMAADVRIVSALLGLVALDDPVPGYRLEFAATLPPLGGLATFWRDRSAEHLREVAGGRRVWDLLPGEHARIWPGGLREQLDVVTVRFTRPDGRAANAARTKVAKGRLTAWLVGVADADEHMAAQEADLGADWELTSDTSRLTATLRI